MSDAISRLLIVDDDPELLHFLLDELSGAGHQCSGCDNGQDALLRLRQASPTAWLAVAQAEQVATFGPRSPL